MRTARTRAPLLALAVMILAAPIETDAAGQSSRDQASWIEVGSEHFVLLTDTNQEKGVRLLRDLESRYSAFTETIQPLDLRQFRIRVFLIDDRTDFERLLPESVKTGIDLRDTRIPERSAYLFHGPTDSFIVARDRSVDELIDDVGHSLGHLLLSRSVLWQPFWLLEGVGEFVRWSGRGAGNDAVEPEESYPLEDLVTIVPSENFDDLGDGGAFRTQAYHLFRLLLEDHRDVLSAYFESLRQEGGFDAHLEMDTATFEGLRSQVLGYRDGGLGLREVDFQPIVRDISVAEADSALGDLAVATGLANLARAHYQESRLDAARLGLAVLAKSGEQRATSWRGFEQLIRELPDSGLAHYHFGTLQAETDHDRQTQIAALEIAIRLLPRMGRAYAELGFLLVMDGRPQEAIPLIERSLDLEPEFADRSFDVLAEARFALLDDDGARQAAQTAATLPHLDSSTLEHYQLLVPDIYRRLDSRRREQEALRVDQLRREVQALADERDPRPAPTREGRVPQGLVHFELSSNPPPGVQEPTLVSGELPEYTADFRRRRIQGQVVVDVDLDRQGRVTEMRIRSSDDADLSEAVRAAMRRWRFDPARHDDESVAFSFRLTFTFDIQE